MQRELTFERISADIDRLLGIQPSNVDSAIELASTLTGTLDTILEATEPSKVRERLQMISTSIEAIVAKLSQSLINLQRAGALRTDWLRFAQYDLIKLKDELLALREFLSANKGFIKSACLRARARTPYRINPKKLFEELHELGAISERTWVLLLSSPSNDWRWVLKNQTAVARLARISGWLYDLQEVRRSSSNSCPKSAAGRNANV